MLLSSLFRFNRLLGNLQVAAVMGRAPCMTHVGEFLVVVVQFAYAALIFCHINHWYIFLVRCQTSSCRTQSRSSTQHPYSYSCTWNFPPHPYYIPDLSCYYLISSNLQRLLADRNTVQSSTTEPQGLLACTYLY